VVPCDGGDARSRGALKDPGTLALLPGLVAVFGAHEKLMESYRMGTGISWGDFHSLLSSGAKRFFQPLYERSLVPNLPPEVEGILRGGAAVADIGCGEGVSATVIAAAFPDCAVTGFDNHAPSIDVARANATARGLNNAKFTVANAEKAGPANAFDLVLFFDCFHDMPVASAAAKNAHRILKPGGIVLLIELMSSEEDSVEAQLAQPSCAWFASISCQVCLPCSMQNNGDALGTVVPTETLRRIFVHGAGFASLETLKNRKFNSLGFRMLLARK
jgi:ubiquinone/menaquinone biosynthesis C-methylase UbiE